MTAVSITKVMFLHGYTTPGEPPEGRIEAVFDQAGMEVTVVAPTAPSGRSRLDPYNPHGRASWFRYRSDHTSCVPQRLDRARAEDVREVLFGQAGLVEMLGDAVARDGAARVAIVGESQGGVLAALLAVHWNLTHPSHQVGALGLVRTAPDPLTWMDLCRSESDSPWPTGPGRVPPRFDTSIAMVLGAEDQVFRPYTSIYAAAPLLESNPVASGIEVPGLSHPEGNTRVRILPGVSHASHSDVVFRALADLILLSSETGAGSVPQM